MFPFTLFVLMATLVSIVLRLTGRAVDFLSPGTGSRELAFLGPVDLVTMVNLGVVLMCLVLSLRHRRDSLLYAAIACLAYPFIAVTEGKADFTHALAVGAAAIVIVARWWLTPQQWDDVGGHFRVEFRWPPR